MGKRRYETDEDNPSTTHGRIFLIGMIKNTLVQARLEDDFVKRYKMLVEYYFELASLVDENKKKFKGVLDKHDWYYHECRKALSKITKAQIQGQGMVTSNDILIFDKWQFALKRLEQLCGIGIRGELDISEAMAE